MNIVFLGAPGTGKGTIASRIAKQHDFTHIAPGDLFRKEAKKRTEFGQKIKERIEKGILITDDITNQLIKQYVKQRNIFDGYPRTLAQAKALDRLVNIDSVILFEMSEQQIVERLGDRRTCPQCHAIYHTKNIPAKEAGICDMCGTILIKRKDDESAVVKKRLKVYHEKTAPLIQLYEKRRLIKRIDAGQSLKHVINSVKRLLKINT